MVAPRKEYPDYWKGLSDTAKLAYDAQNIATSEAEKKSDPAILARQYCEKYLCLELLTRCPEWFEPKKEGEQPLVLNETLLKNEPRLKENKELLEKVITRVSMVREEEEAKKRRIQNVDPKILEREIEEEVLDQNNPFRAGIALGLLAPCSAVVLDDEEYLGRRVESKMMKLKVSNFEYGALMKRWLGDDYYRAVAESTLAIMNVVRQKKILGQEAEVLRQKMVGGKAEEKAVMQEQYDDLVARSLVTKPENMTVFGVGNMTSVFLGRDHTELASDIEKDKKQKLVYEATRAWVD